MSWKIFLRFNLEPLNRILNTYFVYPNIHLPRLSSQTRPHNRVEFIVFFFPSPLLLGHVFFRVLLFSSLHENRHFKIPIRSSTRSFFGFVCENTLNIFTDLISVANITKNCHVFTAKTDMIFHSSLTKTVKMGLLG